MRIVVIKSPPRLQVGAMGRANVRLWGAVARERRSHQISSSIAKRVENAEGTRKRRVVLSVGGAQSWCAQPGVGRRCAPVVFVFFVRFLGSVPRRRCWTWTLVDFTVTPRRHHRRVCNRVNRRCEQRLQARERATCMGASRRRRFFCALAWL